MAGSLQIANLWCGYALWDGAAAPAAGLRANFGIIESYALHASPGQYAVQLSQDIVFATQPAGGATHGGFAAVLGVAGLTAQVVQGGNADLLLVTTFDAVGGSADAAIVQLWIMAYPTID